MWLLQKKGGRGESQPAAIQESAEQRAARARLREVLAGLKVCAKGATYEEFRKQRTAFEICIEANHRLLTDNAVELVRLSFTLGACDHCWRYQMENSFLPIIYPNTEHLAAMRTITPSITNKVPWGSYEEVKKDPDFYAPNYVRRALRMIDDQSDTILARLDESQRVK
jgi:hypothetical protein